MNKEQKVAFIQAQTVCAYATIEGMKAENQHRLSLGQTIAYDEEAFFKVASQYGLEHNQVLLFLGE